MGQNFFSTSRPFSNAEALEEEEEEGKWKNECVVIKLLEGLRQLFSSSLKVELDARQDSWGGIIYCKVVNFVKFQPLLEGCLEGHNLKPEQKGRPTKWLFVDSQEESLSTA